MLDVVMMRLHTVGGLHAKHSSLVRPLVRSSAFMEPSVAGSDVQGVQMTPSRSRTRCWT